MLRPPSRSTLFPYRRSSDLICGCGADGHLLIAGDGGAISWTRYRNREIRGNLVTDVNRHCGDRKSTRLNSSHTVISYAVFCLKKKTTTNHSAEPICRPRPRG